MLCNMRSKLIPTDHIYIHKYRNVLSVDTFVNVLKKFVDCMSYTIMLFVLYNKNSNGLLKDFWGMKREKLLT